MLSQTLVPKWQYSWGGDREDEFKTMIPIPGNQYLFLGSAASNISCTKTSVLYGGRDYVVMIFDDSGNKLMEKSYGGANNDNPHSVIQVSSGGYIIAGGSQSDPSGIKSSPLHGIEDFWVVRIDNAGNLLWEKSYGGGGLEIGMKIIATPDGGFLIGGLSLGTTSGYNFGSGDYKLIKIDANGNLLWSKLYGGTAMDELYDLIEGSDGNYFLCGISQSGVSGNKTSSPIGGPDVWLVKVAPEGSKIWDKSFGTTGNEYRGTLLSLTDGNILLVESSDNVGRIRKVNTDGIQLWVQSCAGNNQDLFEVATQDFNNGNIYVAGSSKTNSFGCKTSPFNGGGSFGDYWITVFDAAGNKIADLDYGGNDVDIPTDIDIVNNELWVTGWSDSPLSGNKTTNNCGGLTADGWVIRFSKNLYINNLTVSAICSSQNTFKVHFTTANNFIAGNIFTVQLVDPAGNSQPIGSLTAIKSDSIVVNIPAGLPSSPNYKLRIVSTQPADTSDLYSLVIYGSPVVNLGADKEICMNNNLTLSPGPQSPNSQYLWNDGSSNSTHIVGAAGLYWCRVQNGCGTAADSILISISLNQVPFANIRGDTSFCSGSSIILRSSPHPNDVTYLWSNGAIVDSISIQQEGSYWLRTSNVCGSTADTLRVTRNFLPTNFLKSFDSLCMNEKLTINTIINYNSYRWSTGEISPTISITTPGQYILTVIDSKGCVGGDSILVVQKNCFQSVYLPNAFTPNGDKKNDIFKAFIYGVISSFRLEIYNRYGENVFITTDPEKGWDGIFKGVLQPVSTYTWHCTYQLAGKKMISDEKGMVILIR